MAGVSSSDTGKGRARSGHVTVIFFLCQLLAATVLLSWSLLFFMARGISDFEHSFITDMQLLTDVANKAWKNMTNPELQSLLINQQMRTKRGLDLTLHGSRWTTAAVEQNGCQCCPGEMDKWGINRRCPPGPQGPRGPRGADGEHGSPGQHGSTGRHGDDMVSKAAQPTCILCPAGPPGLPGVDGEVGPVGPRGANGRNGVPAPPALQGAKGLPGLPGKKVKLSDVLKPWADRTTWATWCDSDKGHTCPQGAIGYTGRPGMPGETPRTVVPGSIGSVGFPGRQGAPGATGIAGPPGRPGAAGRDAEYCTCPKRSAGAESKQRYSTGGDYYRWIRGYLNKRHL